MSYIGNVINKVVENFFFLQLLLSMPSITTHTKTTVWGDYSSSLKGGVEGGFQKNNIMGGLF